MNVGESVVLGRPDSALAASSGEKYVNLTPWNAYSKGVARRHATIRVDAGENDPTIILAGCGACNGTWVNGTEVRAQTEVHLQTGDILTFGTLRLHFTVDALEEKSASFSLKPVKEENFQKQ